MNINKLVSNNQSIKIVPSVEESLENIGLDMNIDKATQFWFKQLLLKWKTWKKSTIVDDHFYSFIESSPDPFRVALVCIVKCPEFKDCKVKSLPFYILESIFNWSQKQNGKYPPESLKLPAFHVGINQRNQNFLTLVIKTYHVCTIKDKIIPIAKEMIKNDNSKQALQIVIAMELFQEISVEELLFPFILQDRATMIDEYLIQFPNQVQPLITFLDKLLDKNFSVINYSQEFIYKYNITNVNYTKIHYKPLGKLVARLCNKFNIPIESCKNLSKNRTTSGLKYLIYQKYIDHNVSLSVWDDLVKDSLKNSVECAQEFIDILVSYDVKEALKWATYFNIPQDNLPLSLKNLSLQDEQQEEDWDDNMISNENQFYKIPIPENNIMFIDTVEELGNVVSHLANCTVIGVDCEWKPSFGAAQSHVALMQIATYHNVYLIDTLKLNDRQYSNVWYTFNKTILENAEIIKVGFGLEQDLREMKSSIIGLSNIRIKGEGILDLGLLWKALIHCGLSLAAGSDPEGNGLSSLVQSCFGLPLEKSEQCSNWELRPLRKTQINYAALDAYVLVAIYKYLNDVSIEQRLNFDEVCNDVMLDKKPKSTKKTKVADRLLASKFNFEPNDAKNIKFLIEPELSILISYLRYLGLDVIVTSQSMLWHDAVKLALAEDRLILTSKMKFTPTLKYPQTQIYEVGKLVNNISSISEQITNILKNFNIIIQQSDLLSRCIKCNGLELRQISTNEISKICNTVAKPSVCDNTYNSDNEDDAYYDDFLSDSEDHSCLYQATNVTSEKCLTRKGIEIETGDIHKIAEAKKPATLCESCGKIYWADDLSLKLESDVSLLLPIAGNKNL